MKCPKCGYLGFETSERCRNCGYDFSLSIEVPPASELPLHSSEGPGTALEDFPLDLDRVIGEEDDDVMGGATLAGPTIDTPAGVAGVRGTGAGGTGRRAAAAPATPPSALPLFSDGDDDTPLITAARPPRAPLSVRRTTPEIPRVRARSVTPRPDEGELAFPTEAAEEPRAAREEPVVVAPVSQSAPLTVGAGARLGAALIDMAVLAVINAAVVYLTLAMVGLTLEDFRVLPLLPLAMFFVILDGGYLVAYIAASGQTIGKMVAGIRVMGDDGQRVEIGAAVLRAAGCGVSLLTAGLGYLPAFLTADGRALQDRLSRTRVVSAR